MVSRLLGHHVEKKHEKHHNLKKKIKKKSFMSTKA